MSWGERSCRNPCRAPSGYASPETCHVDCPHYIWNGITPQDSVTKHMPIPHMPRKHGSISALAMMAAFGGAVPMPKIKDREIKKCLKCGKEHTHNNCFCSAECCRNYEEGSND